MNRLMDMWKYFLYNQFMKILVISDTHGKINKAVKLFEKLRNIDAIIHCGDYGRDGELLGEAMGLPVFSVSGNCDSDSNIPKEIEVETPYGNILVVHGNSLGVSYDTNRLLYKTEEAGCVAACFGHTHIPFYHEFNGIYVMNPGSLTYPRDNTQGSYGIIHATEKDFHGSIVYYETIFGFGKSNKSSKASGGFIRGLLNHSDRF